MAPNTHYILLQVTLPEGVLSALLECLNVFLCIVRPRNVVNCHVSRAINKTVTVILNSLISAVKQIGNNFI